jgi:hypothetical protein
MTYDEKRSKRLEQVRALLAKAESTQFPEEAQTFREHADKLMLQYAFEAWQVSPDQPSSRPDPEMRMFDMSWWRNSNPFSSDIWWLMNKTAEHCRCVAVYWDWKPGHMKVVGLPADLDYFDLLFTQLMLEHAKRMEPKPDANGEVGEEVFKLRQAGVDWMRITKMVYNAGLTELTVGEKDKQMDYWDRARWASSRDLDPNPLVWENLISDVQKSVKNRLANANRRYVKQTGLQGERNYTNPRVYQRSFSEGFIARIVRRMAEMRGDAEAPGDGNGMALALRDIRSVVIHWVDENYPKPEPDKRKSKAVSREQAFDWNAYNAGSTAAQDVNISANPGKGLDNQKELGR